MMEIQTATPARRLGIAFAVLKDCLDADVAAGGPAVRTGRELTLGDLPQANLDALVACLAGEVDEGRIKGAASAQGLADYLLGRIAAHAAEAAGANGNVQPAKEAQTA